MPAVRAHVAQVGRQRRGRDEQAQQFQQDAVGEQMKARPAVKHQFRRPPQGRADEVVGIAKMAATFPPRQLPQRRLRRAARVENNVGLVHRPAGDLPFTVVAAGRVERRHATDPRERFAAPDDAAAAGPD